MEKKKNVIDKFLNFYEKKSNEEVEYERVYVKPNKTKCIIFFIISLIFMFMILRYLLSFNLIFFIIFFTDLLFCLYYGYNLFSKKGLAIRKYIVKKKE